MTKVLYLGDLQIGAGAGYGREPGDRLEDQVDVLQKACAIGDEYGCAFMANGGDTFEGPIVQPEHYDAFRRGVAGWGKPIVAVTGNGIHDAIKRAVSAPEAVGLGMHVFSHPDVYVESGVAVACFPWVGVNRLVAARNGGDRAAINQEAAGHLISIAQGLRADCREIAPDLPCILLTHFGIEGGVTATGAETISFPEPVLPIADLQALGFDAILASHIHKPMLLSESPLIVQGGSPMPLSFGEAGEHGVWIFDTETGTAEFVPIESRRFVELNADLTSAETSGLAYIDLGYAEKEQPVKGAIVKVRYKASAEQAKRVDHRAIRDALYHAGAHKVYAIEANVERETRARVEGVDENLGEMEALSLYIEAQGIDSAMAERMRERTTAYIEEA